MKEASRLLRLLGDEARLRLLRVLAKEPLNVSELTAVLGLAQSGVSRHVRLLRDAGLVTEKRAGTFAWYSLAPEADRATGDRAPLWAWLRAGFDAGSTAAAADDVRLEEIRRLRKESFLDHGAKDERRQLVPGRSWVAWSRALGLLMPPVDVADLGCGEGYLTIEAARWARRVTAIDRSAAVLGRAKAMAARRKVGNIVWKRGELHRLPLADASCDLVLLSQALHHAADPAVAVAEARRILRPGGRVLVLDLRRHQEDWVRSTLGDQWLGFTDEELQKLLVDAGLDRVRVRLGVGRQADPFAVLVAVGTKPPTSSATRDAASRRRPERRSKRGAEVRPAGRRRQAGSVESASVRP